MSLRHRQHPRPAHWRKCEPVFTGHPPTADSFTGPVHEREHTGITTTTFFTFERDFLQTDIYNPSMVAV